MTQLVVLWLGDQQPVRRDSDGSLPACVWPGCYPIIYFGQYWDELCWECADNPNDPGMWAKVHWEGDPEWCVGCGRKVESAHGPVANEGI